MKNVTKSLTMQWGCDRNKMGKLFLPELMHPSAGFNAKKQDARLGKGRATTCWNHNVLLSKERKLRSLGKKRDRRKIHAQGILHLG